ncbi:MAG: repair protein SbcD/Mre11 [Streptosporangiaceae bacterium]|jgi:exonuclease SbcD|nr:repair protein SbcD/Mre11 [Streptosporangiaceae bacterium]
MRLIHTSDWHLGRTLHSENLLPHQDGFLRWLLDEAVRQQAGAVVVAGDIYDRAVPSLDAVRLLDATLLRFAQARIPVILTSGNHDSAVRLGFGAGLSEAAGIHLRTSVADLARPVLLADEHGPVAVYGVPYLLPDAVMADLGVQSRTHEAVLAEAARLIRADAAARGIGRTVVAAHAFVTGGQPAESERDIRVGGVADVPAAVFAGFSYVALGHLHGAQRAGPPPGPGPGPLTEDSVTKSTVIRYSGSPLAFSFSEKDHRKSVTLAEIDAAGQVRTTALPTPVPRPLREVRGTLDSLLARADQHGADAELAGLAGAWVKVVLTDTVRPAAPMERLREKWPHTLVLDFAPEGQLTSSDADLERLASATDPVEICGMFVEFTSGGPADDTHRAVLRAAVEAAQHAESAA